MNQDLLLTTNTILVAASGYFLKKTFDKVEATANDVSEMKPKLDILWRDKIAPSSSPRQLNDRGTDILNTSGIKNVVDEKRDLLLRLVKEKSPTSFEVEQNLQTMNGARTVTMDSKTGHLFTMAQERGPAPAAPPAGGGRGPQGVVVPGSFTIVMVGQ